MKGERSEASYEGSPACPDQAPAGSVACVGVIVLLLPVFSSLHAAGRKRAEEGSGHLAFQGHISAAEGVGERWMM